MADPRHWGQGAEDWTDRAKLPAPSQPPHESQSNWRVPGDGKYNLRIRVDVPDFPRHDRTNGDRDAEPIEVEFTGFQIKTGQKKS